MKGSRLPPAELLTATWARHQFEFTLQVELAEHDPLMEPLLARLDEACLETLVGAGATCCIELQFVAPARTAEGALRSTAEAVGRAFPGARIVRIVPAPDTPSASDAGPEVRLAR